MKVLGVIQAREGSKRVKNKNIRLLAGKPLIAYTIEASKASRILNRTIVSTDSKEIAKIAKRYGADVPFMRPKELAQDSTPDRPVLQHAVNWLIENANYYPEAIVILRPTSPLKTSKLIDEIINTFKESGADSVRTVNAVLGSSHPYWTYKMDENGRAKPFCEGINIEKYYQRQLLPDAYQVNGVVDIVKTDVLMNHELLWGEDMRLFEISEEMSIDIDTDLDFLFSEFLLSRKRSG